jgi:hypothetical protein
MEFKAQLESDVKIKIVKRVVVCCLQKSSPQTEQG